MFSKKLRRSAITLIALISASVAVAAAESALKVVRIEGPIDPMGSRLRPVGLPLRHAAGLPLSTRLRIGWSDDRLSINFECEDTRITAVTAQDGVALDGEDSLRVELALGDGRRFVLDASPLGARRAVWVGSDGATLALDSVEEIAVSSSVFGAQAFGTPAQPNQENIEGSSVGIDIPFSVLGVAAPEVGDAWQANFTRFDHDAGEAAIWSWQEDLGSLSFE